MQPLLIWSDIHHRTELAEAVFEQFKGYKKILLGDYFDHFSDNEWYAEKTARWLKYSLQQSDRIHLAGNHDAAYVFCSNSAFLCPGYTPSKNRRIRSILSQYDLNQLKLYHYVLEINLLCSHAGFNLVNLGLEGEGRCITLEVEELLQYIQNQTKDFFFGARNYVWHNFMCQGSRMGEQGAAGPLWLDWSEFKPIKGINQAVGHTAFSEVQEKCGENSINYCLDTNNRHFMLIENGKISLHKTKDVIDYKKLSNI